MPNVCPFVARRTPSRDETTIRHLKSLHRESLKLCQCVTLLQSFLPRKPVCIKKITAVLVMLSISLLTLLIAISAVPLLGCDHQSLFEFRKARGKVLLRKNISLSFGDILTSGTCVPGVSPNGRRGLDSGVYFSACMTSLHQIVFTVLYWRTTRVIS
jgi:hypothetical protein